MSGEYKVTYLLGAGASANSLPTVRKINSSTTEYSNSLRELANDLIEDKTIDVSNYQLRDELVNNLNWLADMGDEYGTIDTYAKFCSDRGLSELIKVKDTLSLFFTIKQHIRKLVDSRYRNFLIKVNQRSGLFPENIKILNWNYDFQMQLAAQLFRKETFQYSKSISSSTPPLIPYYPPLGNEFYTNHSNNIGLEWSLVHLNGIAGFYYYKRDEHILNYHYNQELENINQLFTRFNHDKENKLSLLTFAYENNNGANFYLRNRIKYASKIIENTDILVVIGYSFPIDNVLVDQQLLNVLANTGLKKIIFQNPTDNGEGVIGDFDLKNIELVHVPNCFDFHIPRELKLVKHG